MTGTPASQKSRWEYGHLYAGLGGSLRKSTDQGDTWPELLYDEEWGGNNLPAAEPYPISMPTDRIVTVYTTTTQVGIYLPTPPEGVTLIGREADNSTHYPIVQQTNLYLLWGFDGSPEAMTETGKELFVNLAWYIE